MWVSTKVFDGGTSDQGPWYLDANTKLVENPKNRKYRLAFWVRVKVSLIHHLSVFDGVPRYDVGTLVTMISSSYKGVKQEIILNNVALVPLLTLKNRSWSSLAKEAVRLHSEMSQVTDPGLKLGYKLLPKFLLGALDPEPDYAVHCEPSKLLCRQLC